MKMENVDEKFEDESQILNLSECWESNSNTVFWRSEERDDGGGRSEGFVTGGSNCILRGAGLMIFDWLFILGSIIAGWRLSLGIVGIPALILLILSCFIIEPPEYLIEQGRLEEARNIDTYDKH